jgi:hypothetical protein
MEGGVFPCLTLMLLVGNLDSFWLAGRTAQQTAGKTRRYKTRDPKRQSQNEKGRS